MMLIIWLNGFQSGIYKQVTAYLDHTPADLIVAEEDVTNLLGVTSLLPANATDLARSVPGLAQVIPIVSQFIILDIHDKKVVAYLVGYDPDIGGGPWALKAGRVPLKDDEVVLDWVMAETHHFSLGDTIEILDEDFTKDITALTRADFAREERQIIKDMSVELLNIMNLSGLLIGLAVTALTLYTSTLHKRQEYGVLKAIGAKNWHLYTVVISQAFLSLTIGFSLAISMVWLMGLLLPWIIPSVILVLTTESVLRVVMASLLIGGIAALAPIWQIAQLDPARVFRG